MTDRASVLGLVNAHQAREYFDLLFGAFDIPAGAAPGFAVRGVGEKSTPAEGALRSSEWLTDRYPRAEIEEKLERWASNSGGAFVVPAFVRGDMAAPANIKEDDVLAYTAMLVDIDKGEPVEALKHAVKHLGEPSMVVESGGKVESGKPKLHAYWCFTESSDSVRAIADARELLAMKLGGDPSFGRVPQIIRIPGSVHLKGGVPNAVRIVHRAPHHQHDAGELVEKIHDMPPAPGQEAAFERWQAKKAGATLALAGPLIDMVSGGLTFGPQSSAAAPSGVTGAALVTDVHAGGEEDRTRWSEFSKVAGHYIHCARAGEITIEEAFSYAGGWVTAHMVPPWAPDRVAQEFRAILNKDIRDKGPIAPPSESRHLVITTPDGAENPQPENPLLAWSPARWVKGGQIPERKWLVKGLVPAKKPCALVAEGGAGKTYMSLDLALKIAGGSAAAPQAWMGEPIPEDAYGTAIVITAEDDKDEIAIRLSEIDQAGLRYTAGDRLIVLPLLDVGGTFPLATSRRIHRQGITIDEHGPTDKWDQLLAVMKALPATGGAGVKLVVIDTLNATMHGEENSATVVQEYFRQATRVCGELGAALLVTHHLRKQNPKDPIITIEDAASAFRGSEAIRASVRQVITFWHAHDYRTQLEGMGLEAQPRMLYRAAVTKANNREALSGAKVLLRNAAGTLDDITGRATSAKVSRTIEAKAWLAFACIMAADAGHPYTETGASGPFKRKGELPPVLRSWSRRAFEGTIGDLVRDGALVTAGKGYLCGPGSAYAAGLVKRDDSTAHAAPDWSAWEFSPTLGAVVQK